MTSSAQAAADMEFTSALGCRVRVTPTPGHLDPRGAMLVLTVDGRMAELYLDPDNIASLESMLRRWREELADTWTELRNGPVEG